MQEEGKQLDKTYISVGVESGGCSGLSYKMDFTPEMPENAELYEDNGVKVVVEKKSLLYLIGTTLEYSGASMEKDSVLITLMRHAPAGVEKASPFNPLL